MLVHELASEQRSRKLFTIRRHMGQLTQRNLIVRTVSRTAAFSGGFGAAPTSGAPKGCFQAGHWSRRGVQKFRVVDGYSFLPLQFRKHTAAFGHEFEPVGGSRMTK